ncbi:MAG: thioredoxin [Planctomycetota bacterium]
MSVVTIDNDNFETLVVDSGSPALVDFYATWCGPCKVIAPLVDELAKEYAGKGLKVGKVDIDTAPELATRFRIQGVPTLLFFKDGKVVDQLVGAHPKRTIEQKVQTITS